VKKPAGRKPLGEPKTVLEKNIKLIVNRYDWRD
jgi:hypothetical protein